MTVMTSSSEIDLDADAAELALGVALKEAKLFGRHVRRVRVELAHHSLDGALDHLLCSTGSTYWFSTSTSTRPSCPKSLYGLSSRLVASERRPGEGAPAEGGEGQGARARQRGAGLGGAHGPNLARH